MRDFQTNTSVLSQYAVDKSKERSFTPRSDTGDFPGGPVVKNLPSNAEDAGSIPGWGTKIPYAAGQLSPHAATTEPMRLN